MAAIDHITALTSRIDAAFADKEAYLRRLRNYRTLLDEAEHHLISASVASLDGQERLAECYRALAAALVSRVMDSTADLL